MFKAALFVLLTVLFLAGCQTCGELRGPQNPENPVWRGETVRVLAQDLREDGDIDYVWPDWVPDETRAELVTRAETLNQNHTGE